MVFFQMLFFLIFFMHHVEASNCSENRAFYQRDSYKNKVHFTDWDKINLNFEEFGKKSISNKIKSGPNKSVFILLEKGTFFKIKEKGLLEIEEWLVSLGIEHFVIQRSSSKILNDKTAILKEWVSAKKSSLDKQQIRENFWGYVPCK